MMTDIALLTDNGTLKTAKKWLEDPIVQNNPGITLEIWVNQGWQHDDGVTLETPITLEDFRERLSESTCHYFPSAKQEDV